MDKDIKKQAARIDKIFPKGLEDTYKNENIFSIYKNYLNNKLCFPIELTSVYDFNWEEFYFSGPGSQKEYEKLKKTNPSFTDIYDGK